MARRKLIWARMSPAISTLTNLNTGVGGAIESQDLLQSFRSQAGTTRGPVGLTVMRVRMKFYFNTGTAAADVLAGNLIYYGLRVMDFNELVRQETAETFDQGPITDAHSDWMAWGAIPVKATNFNSAGSTTLVSGWEEVDVKSMRKIDELGQTLGLVLQGTNATVSSYGTVHASTSVLLALP